MSLTLEKKHRSFGGHVELYRHASSTTGTDMRFAVYRPPAAERGPVPVLWWLSGLECNEHNFIQKAGALGALAEQGIMLVAPDTSPRGAGVPGEDASWDLGTGAGFYVDATEEPWSRHYRMYSYLTGELPDLVGASLPADMSRQSISGHSMGGHGALVLALRNPGRYRSVSAFSPIVAPSEVPWGDKAFTAYLGADRATWTDWDATSLLARRPPGPRTPFLIDQGTADPFLETQLRPERLEAACRAVDWPLTLRRQPGYDHGYYFISTFIGEHVAHHGRALAA